MRSSQRSVGEAVGSCYCVMRGGLGAAWSAWYDDTAIQPFVVRARH